MRGRSAATGDRDNERRRVRSARVRDARRLLATTVLCVHVRQLAAAWITLSRTLVLTVIEQLNRSSHSMFVWLLKQTRFVLTSCTALRTSFLGAAAMG